eukprot:6480425-Alexandrium_andersonii.AAC.1
MGPKGAVSVPRRHHGGSFATGARVCCPLGGVPLRGVLGGLGRPTDLRVPHPHREEAHRRQ